jgi:MFS family permease
MLHTKSRMKSVKERRTMAVAAPGMSEDSSVPAPATDASQPWPSRAAAWYALIVITFATFLNFFDGAAFGLSIEQIKNEFHLTNIELGWLTGPANIVFYLVVMLPLSRMVDIYPRRIVLSAGLVFISIFNAASGLALGFVSLFATRMLVGAGGSAHAPGAYSLLADSFPPERRALPFSFLQLGFIVGTSWGFFLAGQLLGWVFTFPEVHLGPVAIHGWRWMLLILAVPGIISALLLLMIKEPPRRGVIGQGDPLPFKTVMAEVWSRRAVYGPLFISLAFGAAHALAVPAWLTPLFKRNYGWNEMQIGTYLSPILFAGQIAGLLLGPALVTYFSKRRNDANILVSAICLTLALPFSIAAPMMPNGVLALMCLSVVGAMGIASAAPQNLAIQLITPNQMRGQVTGLYLMMFTAFGSLGSLLVGIFVDKVFGHDTDVWKALVLAACILSPLAVIFMWRAVKPYGAEVARLEQLAQENPNV